MGASRNLSSLSCELRIIQARNVELKSAGTLFVRYYLSAGNNKRVELNTREIPSKSNFLVWNESFSLQCQGAEDSINKLKQESIVFELRWRRIGSVFGKLRKSELLGRAEISWESVFESPKMEVEKWVTLVLMNDRVFDVVKPPLLKVEVKVKAQEMVREERMKKKQQLEDLCGCRDGERCNCADYDAFVLAAAFEAL